MIPNHLGGHMNKTHIDRGALEYMMREHGVRSMYDVGCGPGSQVWLARDLGCNPAFGVDGDWTVLPAEHRHNFEVHDFVFGPYIPSHTRYDMVWSVEFLEHLEEQYLSNIKPIFDRARFAVITHALPGAGGHHHVNCQTPQYWKDLFSDWGFDFKPVFTEQIRKASTMAKPFMQNTGMVFERTNTGE